MSRAQVRSTVKWGGIWWLLVVLGCSPYTGSDGPGEVRLLPDADAGVGHTVEPIIAGEVTYERPSVGRWGGCTATLIAEDAIVLAAHCRGYASRTSRGNYGYFYIRPERGVSHRYVVDRYRSYGRGLGQNDVMIAHLRERVPSSVATPARLGESEPTSGQRLTIYGYGCTRRGYRGDGMKRKFVYNFGDRTNQLCPGDSGGPVMTDASEVIRVNSGYYTGRRGGDIFGEIPVNFDRLVAQLRDWGTVYPAPGTPEVEPPPAPEGDPEMGPEEAPPPAPPAPPAPEAPLAERCAAASSCGECTAIEGCGYCWEGGRCMVRDGDGGPSESCHGGFTTPGQSCGDPRNSCGIYAPFPEWTCRGTRTGFARCRPGGTPEFLVCPDGFSCERRSRELVCRGSVAPEAPGGS